MKKNVVYALVLALAAPLAACGGGQEARLAQVRQPSQPMTDAEIAAVLDAVNRAEIQQAELARERAEDNQVRNYATSMLTGHRAAVQQQQMILQERGIARLDTVLSAEMREQAQRIEQELAGLQGPEFDRAYMDAQMRQHQQVLTMLENQMIPAAQDPQYRAYLEQLRSRLEMHLRNAEQIQMQTAG